MAVFGLTSCGDDIVAEDSGVSNIDLRVSKSSLQFSKTGGTIDIYVQSSQAPTVTSDADWCTMTEGTSESSTVRKYSLAVQANANTDDRTATVTISDNSSSATIAVTQTSTEGLIIETTSFDVAAEGGNITVRLKANGDYEATPDCEWITETTTRANMEDLTNVFNVSSNVSGVTRTGKITFTRGDIVESVTVNQAAGAAGEITATAQELAKLMYPGWNLGNTMEASGSGVNAEVSWQSTRTTQEIVDYVKSLGFKSIRIPCSWYSHFTENSTQIDEAWMARVKEVVDYGIRSGLYVILNDHYDLGWLEKSFGDVTDANVQAKSDTLNAIWTQVANEFKNYDEHLLFAGLNEPDVSTAAQVTALVKYEQVFIDAVRATGGNNAQRTLIVQGPSTDIDKTYSLYNTLPTDNVQNRLMVEVHFYSPWQFCGLEEDADWGVIQYYWGEGNHVDGSDRNADSQYEESFVAAQFNKMKTKFVDNGYPVILGEYGTYWRDMSAVNGDQTKHDASVKAYYKAVNKYAVDNGMVPYAWDTNYCVQHTYTIIKRSNCTVYDQYMMDGITEGVAEGVWPY